MVDNYVMMNACHEVSKQLTLAPRPLPHDWLLFLIRITHEKVEKFVMC